MQGLHLLQKATLLAVTAAGWATVPAGATNQAIYVRCDAEGANNGSDWANAFREWPKFARGHVYYVAGRGDACRYDSVQFNTPPQDEQVITVQRATVADHGTGAGWKPEYDGQLQFQEGSEIRFTSSDWVFDCVTGQGDGTRTVFGCKMTDRTGGGRFGRLRFGANSQDIVKNIAVRHLEIDGTNSEAEPCRQRFVYAVQGRVRANITLSHLYLHDVAGVPILTRSVVGWTLEDSLVARNHSGPPCHAEAISDQGSSDVLIRNNEFRDIEGTGIIVILNGSAGIQTARNWQIYGNVFWRTGDPRYGGLGNGAIACINRQVCSDFRIDHNTFFNYDVGRHPNCRISWAAAGDASTGNVARNNIFASCGNAVHDGRASFVEIASNLYAANDRDARDDGSETSGKVPFVAAPSGDFRLAKPGKPGREEACRASSPDMNGTERPAACHRGAIQQIGTKQD